MYVCGRITGLALLLAGAALLSGQSPVFAQGTPGPGGVSLPSSVSARPGDVSAKPGDVVPGGLPGSVSAIGTPGSSMGDAAHWSAVLEPGELHPGEWGRVVVTAQIGPRWHIYSLTQPAGGPVATRISLQPSASLKANPVQQPNPHKEFDSNFGINVELFPRSTAFGIPVKVSPSAASGPLNAVVNVDYQVCNDRVCLPPSNLHLKASGSITAGAIRAEYSHPTAGPPAQPQPGAPTSAGAAAGVGAAPANPGGGTSSAASAASSQSTGIDRQIENAEKGGLWRFLLLAITFGFLALATPCVFPMIPITVSFFTKREGEEGGSNVVGAVVYCAGIIGTFTGLGLLLAALFGASGIAQFAANPWVNLIIAAIFLGLAANLMGYFELALPSFLVNKTSSLSSTLVQDSAAPSRGKSLLGTLLMGLTFTLTSFTCTVPFVGTLLVSTTQGNWLWPVVGMLAFSSAFALPFFLLALFPRMLGKLPRAGGWLASVKAFMGFLEIAAAVKFLSNADLVWQLHLVTRPVFLLLWTVIGIAAGLYLLGKIRLAHGDAPRIGPGRRVLGLVMVLVGLYCITAIFGAPLGWFDAYLPPPGYDFGRKALKLEGNWQMDFEEAKALARVKHQPIFVDFTGYTCTNCRWMESHIFPRPEVQEELKNFVLVQLYTDGAGEQYTRNRDLEQKVWNTVALPLYTITDASGNPVKDASGQPAAFAGLNPDPAAFAQFLKEARQSAQAAGL